MFSCTSQTEKKQEQGNEGAPKPAYIKLSKKHLGFWVYEKYPEALKKTKSTKKAGEMGVDDFYNIYNSNSIMRLNIHEGGANNILLMTAENKGQIFSSDTSEAYYNLEFIDDFLLADHKRYLKAPDNSNGFHELVNRAFLSGQYKIDGKIIEIKESGKVSGLDSITHVELNLDYNDAGMQFDKIYFQYINEQEPETYLYEFISDTLMVYQMDCIAKAEDSDFCLEVTKGKGIYKMIKM